MEKALLIFPLWLGAILLWSLGIHILAQKTHPEFRAFAFTAIAAGIYCGAYAGELGSGDLQTMLLWSKLQYIGILTAPYFWVKFTLHYTGRTQLLRTLTGFAMAAFPVIAIVIRIFDHNLRVIYADVTLDKAFNTLAIIPGPLYYVIQAYIYACGLTGMVILVFFGMKRMGPHRRNAFILALVTIIPLVADIIYLSGLNPFGHLDLSPYGIFLSMSLLYFAVLKNDLITVAPIARDFIFEHLPVCVLTFDNRHKLCEANESARAILALSPNCIGMDVSELFSEFYLKKLLPESGRNTFEMTHIGRDFEVQTFILPSQSGNNIGWVITMNDISEHKRSEIRLMHLLKPKNDNN